MTRFILALSGGRHLTADAQLFTNLRRMVGSGLLVAVGYIDPGNWATDIAGGSGFGYGLLCVVVISSLLAMGFQVLMARVALATGYDLAALSSRYLSSRLIKATWLAGEAAILATALAEVIGGAIALRLLFNLPLVAGVGVTAIGTFAVLYIARGNADRHERVIATLLAVVTLAFVFLLFKCKPDWAEVAWGAARPGPALHNPQGFMIALGILGATLMPHNLYLHSGLLAERARCLPATAKDMAIRLARNDTIVSLGIAMLINASILIVAASSLAQPDLMVSSLDGAHRMLGKTLGAGAAIVFAIALYAAGQSSAITGVLAGQILSKGFQHGKWWSDQRRVVATRLAASVIALILLFVTGGSDPDQLLVLSQVVLSLALPFALTPLVMLACRRDLMGCYALKGIWAAVAIIATAVIILLDGYLLVVEALA